MTPMLLPLIREYSSLDCRCSVFVMGCSSWCMRWAERYVLPKNVSTATLVWKSQITPDFLRDYRRNFLSGCLTATKQ